MRHLVYLGQTNAAVAQYHHCERVLTREPGVESILETQRLYQQVLKEDAGVASKESRQLRQINSSARPGCTFEAFLIRTGCCRGQSNAQFGADWPGWRFGAGRRCGGTGGADARHAPAAETTIGKCN